MPDHPLDVDALAEAVANRLAERLAAESRERYMSVARAGQYTGLSPDSIRSLLAGGKLTSYRPIGGRVLIDRRQLDALIQSSTRRPRRGRGRYDRAEKGVTA